MEQLGTISIIKEGDVTIHSFQSPEQGEMTCSQIIETELGVIVVDVLLLKPYAQQLRQYVDGLKKPIEKVLITHTHPDHWFGLEYFQDCQIYALQETIDEISQVADQYIEYNHSVFGDKSTSTKVIPQNVLTVGSEVVAGLELTYTKVTQAEANVMLMIEIPTLKVLVAQDLAYNEVYLYVGEKSPEGELCFDGWISTLENLQKNGYERVLVGHGFNSDSSILEEMIEYLNFAQLHFDPELDPEAYKDIMVNKYPHYKVPRMLDVSNMFLYNQF